MPHDDPGRDWTVDTVTGWLLDRGRFAGDLDALVDGLGQHLLSAGAPVWRVRLSVRTLHPLVAARSSVWEREADTTEVIESAHGFERSAGHIGSPLAHVRFTGQPFRRRLAADLGADDHSVLHELRGRGATDYFAVPVRLSDGSSPPLALVTDRTDGFTDGDVEKFTQLASALAPVVEVFMQKRRAEAVADAYLGPRTGRQVLDGRITRGDVEQMNAAILISDLRDWTGLNRTLPAADALALVNRYFEIVTEAVEDHGGEVLKLIGDGVLAAFPTAGETGDDRSACANAIAAARRALLAAADSDAPLGARFGIGIHFGEVLYGNTGSKTRLDFTVLGPAVNIAARIEGLCGKLGRPVLFSEAVADRLDEPAERVAGERLKGYDDPVAIFGLRE